MCLSITRPDFDRFENRFVLKCRRQNLLVHVLLSPLLQLLASAFAALAQEFDGASLVKVFLASLKPFSRLGTDEWERVHVLLLIY